MDPLLGPAKADLLHVMSYNLRYPADDPVHQWDDRQPAMAKLLDLERPTVIGVQEAYYHQLRDLVGATTADYAWVGYGREGGSHGEFSAILFDPARLDPVEYGDLWLSSTPQAIGSADWGNKIPRMASWARFRDLESGREVVVLNTHLDHVSESAREHSAELLASVVDGFGRLPVIVTGDFNAAAGNSAAYDRLVSGTSLSDTWLAAERLLTPEVATYCGYHEPVAGDRIDWILVSPGIAVEAAAINTNRYDGRYPSDHVPVQALVKPT